MLKGLTSDQLLYHSINYSFTHSLNHAITHSINQSINHPITPSISHALNHSITQSLNQSIDQSINRSIDQSINQLSNKLRVSNQFHEFGMMNCKFTSRVGSGFSVVNSARFLFLTMVICSFENMKMQKKLGDCYNSHLPNYLKWDGGK